MSLESRFWEKVSVSGPDECWLWTAATNEHGYGVMRPEGRRSGPPAKAHRISAELAGMAVDGHVVLHSCDNPPCVNPAHLSTGTQADNVNDMHAKGRGNVGSVNGQACATESLVAAVRRRVSNGERQSDIALELGVPRSTLNYWLKGGWRHVS